MTQFILDSGDPDEYRAITKLAQEHHEVLFGATTNPSLIAKKLAGKKVSAEEAFELQKQIVMEIVNIVPGPVSAEVYADETTTGEQMAQQGKEIASWHERIVVKLPTTLEGLKARTTLRQQKIPINNTLVFSQQQIFAICLHEKLIQEGSPTQDQWPASNASHSDASWPPFISPFVGRLDDIGEDGVAVVEHAMRLKRTYNFIPLILLSSVRRIEHIKRGLDCEVDLITSPASVYQEWFPLRPEQKNAINTKTYASNFKLVDYWDPPQELLAIDSIDSVDAFMQALTSGGLNIKHDLTDKGLTRFAQDWEAIIA